MSADPDDDRSDGEGNAKTGNRTYVLRLYITGTTARSSYAIANVRKICDEHLKDRYQLEVIDISLRPELAEGEQIIAAPTLIKKLPLPLRRFFGDMSHTKNILIGLDLREAADTLKPNQAS